MKYKKLLSLILCIFLTACAQTSPVPSEPEPSASEPPTAPAKNDELVRTRELISDEYDFTHDGQNEVVELVRVEQNGDLLWFELEISDTNGKLLWIQEAHTSHPGWRNLFACRVDGKDYILDYYPTMYQGYATYGYHLVSLTENGEEVYFQQKRVNFDVNFGGPIFTGEYDPAAIGTFMEDVHAYLNGECTLLISTDGSGALTGTPGTEYRGDDFTGGDLYAYEGTWEERFIRLREELEQKPG